MNRKRRERRILCSRRRYRRMRGGEWKGRRPMGDCKEIVFRQGNHRERKMLKYATTVLYTDTKKYLTICDIGEWCYICTGNI